MSPEMHALQRKSAEDDPVLKFKEAARFLGKAYQTLSNLRCLGGGPVHDGKGYRLSELVRWRAEQAEKQLRRIEDRRRARENPSQPSLFDRL